MIDNAEKGRIIRQIDGDLYECLMENGHRYDIEISGYAGNEIDISFTLHREPHEIVYFEGNECYYVAVQAEY